MAQPDPALVDRLAAHRTIGGAPRSQLEWLASKGYLRQFAAGESVVRADELLPELDVILSGHLSIRVARAGAPRRVMDWRAGDVTGVLPYSRVVASPGSVVAVEPTDFFAVPREHLRDLTRECYELTAILVHAMLDRARVFTSSDLQVEKMLSLGRLAAGLAHELNNPAAAVMRSAALLEDRLAQDETAFRALGMATLSTDQLAGLDRIRACCQAAPVKAILSSVERADWEDALTAWLEAHDASPDFAETLAESGTTLEALDELARLIPAAHLEAVLSALAGGCTTRKLASEIHSAAARIQHLVAAVKGFTYMDQATQPKPVDVGKGLSDTVTVHAAKARGKSVGLKLEVEPDLPTVPGLGGELNQVWANLIDNAIDAVAEGGHVTVSASREQDALVVRVVDDGPGIPAEVRSRIFDPFFTTKPVGQGTGLGLEIARRIVERHGGTIEVESRTGRTEFRVGLALQQAAGGA